MRFLILATIFPALFFTIEDHLAVWEPVEVSESTVIIVSANPTTTIITDMISFSTTTTCPFTTPSSLGAGPASSPTIEAGTATAASEAILGGESASASEESKSGESAKDMVKTKAGNGGVGEVCACMRAILVVLGGII